MSQLTISELDEVTAGLINDESKDGVLTHIRKVNPVGVTKWCIK